MVGTYVLPHLRGPFDSPPEVVVDVRTKERDRGNRGGGVLRTPSRIMMREERGSVNGGRKSLAEITRGTPAAGVEREYDVPEANVGSGRSDAGQDDADMNEDDLGAGRASYGDDLDTLDKRRTEELNLIGEYDS